MCRGKMSRAHWKEKKRKIEKMCAPPLTPIFPPPTFFWGFLHREKDKENIQPPPHICYIYAERVLN